MKNPEEFDCPQVKLDLIQSIIEMPCIEIEKYSLVDFFFNYRLSEQQVVCMRNKASKVIFGKDSDVELKDFVIDTTSFKNINLEFDFVHFCFIDTVSLQTELRIQINNLQHTLYYIIINCDRSDFQDFDFNSVAYNAYIVNDSNVVQKITLTNDDYANIRSRFLNRVGNTIRQNTTLNAITECITFSANKVRDFRNELSSNSTFNIRIICIDKNCNINSPSQEVTNYLSQSRNQNRLSLAFQKINTVGPGDYYDIGNMQP